MLVLHPIPVRVYWLAFSPDGDSLASGGGHSPAVRLWDPAAGTLRLIVRPAVDDAGVGGFTFSPDGARLAVRYQGRRKQPPVIVWDVTAAAEEVGTIPDGTVCPAFSPDGQLVATVDEGDRREDRPRGVRFWETKTWQPSVVRAVPRSEASNSGYGSRLAFSADGDELLVAGSGVVRRFDTANGRELDPVTLAGPAAEAVTFGPDRRTAAGVVRTRIGLFTEQHRAVVWDVSTGAVRCETAQLSRKIEAVVLSPDGRLLLTADAGGLVRVWDTATGAARGAFDWRLGTPTAVAVAPDGLRAAVGGKDRVVVWDLDV